MTLDPFTESLKRLCEKQPNEFALGKMFSFKADNGTLAQRLVQFLTQDDLDAIAARIGEGRRFYIFDDVDDDLEGVPHCRGMFARVYDMNWHWLFSTYFEGEDEKLPAARAAIVAIIEAEWPRKEEGK